MMEGTSECVKLAASHEQIFMNRFAERQTLSKYVGRFKTKR